MSVRSHPFHIVLLGLCLAHLGWFVLQQIEPIRGIDGLLYANGTPVGGDFINLWSAGRLVLEGRFAEIYDYEAFMAYEVELTGAPIGVRFWAYPPHSLLLAWPFGLVGFYPALVLWSVLGLMVLALGCRRLGLGAMETAIVLVSPASVLCLYYGQTGNLATGLLLVALSARPVLDLGAIGAAALLTMKPQMGLLLPLHLLARRRWTAIIATTAATLALLVAAWVFTGDAAWRDYLGDTLPGLSLLERQGSGPFMTMIPSMFMALRILTGDGDLALVVHFVLAAPVLALVVWRLWHLDDALRKAALVLVGTAIVTPYLHNYDLTLLSVAALLVLRRFPPGKRGELLICGLLILILALPQLVVLFNVVGMPLSPLLMLGLLLLV